MEHQAQRMLPGGDDVHVKSSDLDRNHLVEEHERREQRHEDSQWM